MNLGKITTLSCVAVAPPPDSRCDDPAYALANPEQCRPAPRLTIKPGTGLICALTSLQFGAFYTENGVEKDVTADAVFQSSDNAVLVIGAGSGNATGVTAGTATVYATYQGITVHAIVTVLPAGDDCCDAVTVAMVVLVDQTRSMTQTFNGSYATKLHYARAAATAFIDSVNETKDLIGLARFTEDETVLMSAPVAEKATVSALVPTIAQTQSDTAFYDALSTAFSALELVTADRKLVLIISDGEDVTPSYTQYPNPIELAAGFKNQGGIVMCLGVRSHSAGFELLNALATGGFFVNAYDGTEDDCIDFIQNLRGYICGGNCTPDGDVTEYRGALNYVDFIQWDVVGGYFDLQGNGFFDYLPNHGLYVDLVAGTNPSGVANPVLRTKAAISITSGKEYRLSVQLAGNQTLDGNPAIVQLQVYSNNDGAVHLNQTVSITDYLQEFHSYGFVFVAPYDDDVMITVQQTQGLGLPNPTTPTHWAGALLNEVVLQNVTDGVNEFFDDFNSENPVYVPPKCGTGTTEQTIGTDTSVIVVSGAGTAAANQNYTLYSGTVEGGDALFTAPNNYEILRDAGTWNIYNNLGALFYTGPADSPIGDYTVTGGAGPAPTVEYLPITGYITGYYCYGDGCLDTPPPGQLQDPDQLANLEKGFTPGKTYTSTKTACAQCPPGFRNGGDVADATQLAGGADTTTTIQLDDGATEILRYLVQFVRPCTGDGLPFEINFFAIVLEGSTDNVAWTELDSNDQSGVEAGTEFQYEFSTLTAAYEYYRIRLTNAVSSTGAGKIVALTVYDGTPEQLVCRSGSATSTKSQADADQRALENALANATDALNCVPKYEATESYTAKCTAPCFGKAVTRSVTATSQISQEDARQKAYDAAKAAAEAALVCESSNNEQQILCYDGTTAPSRAAPYPSTKFVSGEAGTITAVTVEIKNFYSDNPQTAHLLLVSPSGTAVELMRGAGGAAIMSGMATLTFDDTAGGAVPTPPATGSYQVTHGGGETTYPGPAPAGPYGAALSDFNGEDPNGCWGLYFMDDTVDGKGGFIKLGWVLNLTTA